MFNVYCYLDFPRSQFLPSIKRIRLDSIHNNYAVFGDLKFPRDNSLAGYDTQWTTTFNDRTLITVTQCWESSILFAARQG